MIERDYLPETPGARPSTPQATQTHTLLASGRESVKKLLPGAIADLLARGALLWDANTNATIYIGGALTAKPHESAPRLAVSRLLLEAYLRGRVRALANVTVLDRTTVGGLLSARPGKVTGVRLRHLKGTTENEHLDAELVVDATGRPGRSPRSRQAESQSLQS